MKESGETLANSLGPADIYPIEMPHNTPVPFLMGLAFVVLGFGMVFSWWYIAGLGLLGVIAALIYAGFDYEEHTLLSADTIRRTEAALGRLQEGVYRWPRKNQGSHPAFRSSSRTSGKASRSRAFGCS